MPQTSVLEAPVRIAKWRRLARCLKAGCARARQARAVVLASLLAATGVLACALALADGPLRDPVYNARLQRLLRQIRAAREKPFTVVMLGSSRTGGAFRPKAINERLAKGLGRPVAAGNFGLNGCCPATNLLTWNRLLHDGVHPDLVLIEVMPAMLGDGWFPSDMTAERLPIGQLRRCDLPLMENYFGDLRPGLTRAWWLGLPNALYDSRLTLVSRIDPELLPAEHRVVQPESLLSEDLPPDVDDTTPEIRRRGMKAAEEQYAATLQNYHLGGRVAELFHEGLAEIHRAGVRVVLVILPEGPVFRSWYSPGGYEQVTRWLSELQTEFGVEVVDAHDWFEEIDFYDSHHLTPPAAERFSNRLASEHLLPIIQGRAQETEEPRTK